MKRKDFIKTVSLLPLLSSHMELKSLKNITEKFESTEKMPVLFLGHGSPMNAIEENEFVKGFREIGKTLPEINAVLCISAHWYTKGTFVTAMEKPKTIHDFGGFPQALFDVQYPAPGSPALAQQTKEIITSTEVGLDQSWGLDHGAWSVIKHLYPKANVPVIQLSIDYTKPASYHFELAKQLAPLRNKGVLIIGSGNIIHNLGLVDFANIDKIGYGYDWAIDAHGIFNKYLLNGNFNALIDYEKLGSAAKLAIPSPDHYLPLLYTLALKNTNEEIKLFNDKLLAGSLSMTSVRIN